MNQFQNVSVCSNMVFFDMGNICATIKSVTANTIECEIQNEGTIYENSQITFSEDAAHAYHTVEKHQLPLTIMRDEEIFARDIRFCLENDVDYIIHSVYKGHQDIIELKKVVS